MVRHRVVGGGGWGGGGTYRSTPIVMESRKESSRCSKLAGEKKKSKAAGLSLRPMGDYHERTGQRASGTWRGKGIVY